jgi:hypothetical protein
LGLGSVGVGSRIQEDGNTFVRFWEKIAGKLVAWVGLVGDEVEAQAQGTSFKTILVDFTCWQVTFFRRPSFNEGLNDFREKFDEWSFSTKTN